MLALSLELALRRRNYSVPLHRSEKSLIHSDFYSGISDKTEKGKILLKY